jgi:hypothetical protein
MVDEPKQSRFRKRVDRLKAVRPRGMSTAQIVVGYGMLGGAVGLAVYLGSAALDGATGSVEFALVATAVGIVIGLFLGGMGATSGPMQWILAAIWFAIELMALAVYAGVVTLLEIVPAMIAALFSGC